MQKAVDQWIQTIGNGYFSPLTNMVLLAEETGELARIIARVYGDQIPKPGDLSDPKKDLSEEMADVLWVLICLANQTGINLTKAFNESLKKKSTRDANRFNPIQREPQPQQHSPQPHHCRRRESMPASASPAESLLPQDQDLPSSLS